MSESARTPANAGKLRRFFGSLPVMLLLLLVWGTALLWGLGAFALHQRPDLVRNRIDALLAQHCPTVTLSMGAMSPSLWPSPGVRMHDVLLREHNGASLLAEACELQFRWGDLLSGSLVPSRLVLDNATAQIVLLPVNNGDKADKDDGPVIISETDEVPLSKPILVGLTALNGLTIDLRNVAVQLTSAQPSNLGLRIQGLTGSLTAPSGGAAGLLGLQPGEASLHWTEFALHHTDTPETPFFRLRDARLNADSLRLSKDAPGLIRTGQVNLSVLVDVGDPKDSALRDARVDFKAALALTAGPPDIRGQLELSGTWLINGVAVPVTGTLPFGSRDVRTGIDIVDAALRMDTNAARFTATLLPDLSLTGRATVERFSLPRWFAFARNLPDSLVDTLDDIHGNFAFRLTPQGLAVPDLKFSVKDMAFTGSAGVDSWAQPLIRIDAQTDAADANRVFPELVNKPGVAPTFNGPPLIPGPTPLDTPDVGFAIRLKAKQADFWKCTGKGFSLELTPVWSTSGKLVEGAQLNARLEQFYGGRLDVGLTTKQALRMNLTLRNVNGEKLSRAATGLLPGGKPYMGGALNAEANLAGAGDSLAEFLAGLNGSFNATLNGGFFTVNGQRTPFERFAVRADGITGSSRADLKKAPLPQQLSYTARWRVDLTPPAQTTSEQESSPLRLALDATGPLRFSTRFWLPVAAQNVPVRAAGLFGTMPFTLSGKLTAALDGAKVSIADLSGRLAEADVSGNLAVTAGTAHPYVQGTVSASTSDLRRVLTRLGFPDFGDWPKNAFRRGDVSTAVDWRNKTLQLSDMRGTLDETAFSGKLRVVDGRQWTGEMTLDDLDTSRYRNPPDAANLGVSSPWPTAAMKTLDVNADIRVNKLLLMDLLATDCRFPVRLKGGTLTASPITLQLGNAPQEAALRAEVLDNALSLRFSSTVRNADLRSLWKHLGATDSESLGGFGNSTLNLYGLSRSAADIPACLNGTWAGNIQNGFFSSGRTRREFVSLSASGNMAFGVLTSSDFLLSGKNFSVRGGGKVNLVNRTLNYRLTASLPGVPAIPITYSGSLADPKRSINAFSTVASVLGNVGKGVFSLLDSVLSVPLNLLR